MGRQLYVTNIPFQATEEDLRRLFSVAGTVRTIKLLTDPGTGKFKGCGFVEMATAEEAREAVNSLDEVLLMDRLLTVVEARPAKPKAGAPPSPRKKPGRDHHPGRGRK